MTDPAFIAAAFAIVLGGIWLYAVSIGRRAVEVRRVAGRIAAERQRASAGSSQSGMVTSRPQSIGTRGDATEAPP